MKTDTDSALDVHDQSPTAACRDILTGEEYLGDYDAATTRSRWSFDLEGRDSAGPTAYL